MPRRRKSGYLDRKTPQAAYHSKNRRAESEERRLERLQSLRSAKQGRRQQESIQQRTERQEQEKADKRWKRRNESKTTAAKRRATQRTINCKRQKLQTTNAAVTFAGSEVEEEALAKNVLHFEQANIWAEENQCCHCAAYRFPSDPPGQCCNSGKIKLPSTTDPPDVLRDLLISNKSFKINIRSYNNALRWLQLDLTRK